MDLIYKEKKWIITKTFANFLEKKKAYKIYNFELNLI